MILGAIDAFMQNYDSIMTGKTDTPLFDLLESSDPRRKLIDKAKKVGRELIYNDPKKS
jgi:hypothetical protein